MTTYRDAVRTALQTLLREDPRVFFMGEDVGRYGGPYAVSKGLQKEFGEDRVRDTPLCESTFVGAGIGAALGGMRPIVEVMTVNFSLLALDQVVNNAAVMRHMSGGQFEVPIAVRMATGGGKQILADKILCTGICQFAGERQSQQAINTKFPQHSSFLLLRRKAKYRRLRFEQRAGMRLKRKGLTGYSSLVRQIKRCLENHLMAAVHAVKIADGNNATALTFRQRVGQVMYISLRHRYQASLGIQKSASASCSCRKANRALSSGLSVSP